MAGRGFPGVTVPRDNGKDEPALERHLAWAILPVSDGPAHCQSFPLPRPLSSGGFLIVPKLYLAHPSSSTALTLLPYSIRAQGTRPSPSRADKQAAPGPGL